MSWIVALAYLSMAGLLIATWRYRRFLLTPSPIDLAYHPKVALLMGVRGVDPELAAHVESLFRLDYPDYEIVFAVAEADDPAAPLLAGGCAQMPGLSEYLSSNWGIPVELARPFERVQVAPAYAEEVATIGPALAVAVGLGLRRPGDKERAK